MARPKKQEPTSPVEERVVEEHEANEGTGVEAEAEGDSDSRTDRPYDPTKIRVDPKTFSLRQILDMISDKDLDLAPDFQRKKVWKGKEKSRLIESVLLRIPLPAFYFSADGDGRMKVVDGLQRLSTIHDFVRGGDDQKGGFPLRDLEYLTEGVLGNRYGDLDQNWTRRIQQTQIFVNVIDPQTPTQVKFDIFKRLNTGGTPLNAQEIRHCMSNQRSREFLKACTGGYLYADDTDEDEHTGPTFEVYQANGGVLPKKVFLKANSAASAFCEATNWAMWNHVRMADREVVLRFCAFRLIGGDLTRYATSNSMDDFLTATTEQLDDKSKVSDKVLAEIAADLERAMGNARELFGDQAFRKWRTRDDEGRNPINRALFESWGVVLSDYAWDRLEPHKPKIVSIARRKMSKDSSYIESISSGTGDAAKVERRFSVARAIVQEALT